MTKLTRTRLLLIPLLVLSIVAMIGSWTLLISCLLISRKAGGYASAGGYTLYEGEFYTLQKAYDNGYLTYDDLKEIAKMKSKELEDERLKKSIENTYLNRLKEQTDSQGVLRYPNATMDDVSIHRYYGTYNDSVVVEMDARYFVYPHDVREYVIEDIVISYSLPEPVVWRKIN